MGDEGGEDKFGGMNRRDFLKSAAAFFLGEAILPKVPLANHLAQFSKDLEAAVKRETIIVNGVMVCLENDLPVWYTLPGQKGKKITLDPAVVRQKREEAIREDEPAIVSFLPLPAPETPEEPKEKPQKELPSDTLAVAELQKRSLEIINPPCGVQLFLRRGVVAEGGPFESIDGKNVALTIALVDGHSVNSYFMADPRYDRVRDLIKSKESTNNNPDYLRELYVSTYQTDILDMREILAKVEKGEVTGLDWVASEYGLSAAKPGENLAEYGERIIAQLKGRLLYYQQLSDEQLMRLPLIEGPYGEYFKPGSLADDPKRGVIFVAVGKGLDPVKGAQIGFNSKGECQVLPVEIKGGPDFVPKISRSHPAPSDVKRYKKDSTSYLYNPVDEPGFLLRHEADHFKKMSGQFKKRESFDLEGHDEKKTDIEAMKSLVNAWVLWKKEGTDSGYYFVFRTPKGEVIYAKKEKPGQQQVARV